MNIFFYDAVLNDQFYYVSFSVNRLLAIVDKALL